MIRPPIIRFMAKVCAPVNAEDCWQWLGHKLKTGYGMFRINTNQNLPKVLAHRAAWTMLVGEIPAGLSVLHRCDNPSCVNPRHLFLGTQQDNMTDKVNKDRQHRGEQIHQSKLNAGRVLEIRKLHQLNPQRGSQRSLARRFGLPFQTIHKIVSRRSWKHLP